MTDNNCIFSCSRHGCVGIYYCINIDIKYTYNYEYIVNFKLIDDNNKQYNLHIKLQNINILYTDMITHLTHYSGGYALSLKYILNNSITSTDYNIIVQNTSITKLCNYLDMHFPQYLI